MNIYMDVLRCNIVILLIISTLGCFKGTDSEDFNCEQILLELSSDTLKQVWLEEIYLMDQKVRNDETAALKTYGHDSKEHKESWEVIKATDSLNLVKIECYLDEFGYPSENLLGAHATSAPWSVIHHSMYVEPRKRNFPYLYEAYIKGDLSGSQFTMYLGRYHRMIFGERLKMENPYREEDEVKTYIEKLKLNIE